MHAAMVETRTIDAKRRLLKDGWYLDRHGANHDIYRHPTIMGIITLPRHKQIVGRGRAVDCQEGRLVVGVAWGGCVHDQISSLDRR